VHIIEKGSAWFSAMGTDDSKGVKLYQVSGPVARPGVYEMPMGATFRELLVDLAGGPTMEPKAIVPGGSSTPMLPWNDATLDMRMDYASCARAGTMLGTGGVIVVPRDKCMVDAMYNVVRFYAHESCGKCTPCREGIATWLPKMYQKLLAGLGTREDLVVMEDMVRNMRGTAFCPLADACAMPVQASFKHFRHEYEHLVDHGRPLHGRREWWS
jgi:NADH-quinone oxidoreductase subunit F